MDRSYDSVSNQSNSVSSQEPFLIHSLVLVPPVLNFIHSMLVRPNEESVIVLTFHLSWHLSSLFILSKLIIIIIIYVEIN